MNQILLRKLEENKKAFVPYIISPKQMAVIEKVLANKSLTRTEQNYLYVGIKRKMEALGLLTEKEEPSVFFYDTQDMLPKRKKKAIDILSELKAKGRKAFVSGSFLFSEKYNDVDVFIISGRYKEEHKDDLHCIYIKERDLTKPAFQSAAKSCISNFEITLPKTERKKLHLDETLTAYQETIISILEKEEPKELKKIIFDYALYVMGRILGSCEINLEYSKILRNKSKIMRISELIRDIMLNSFNKNYIIIRLTEYVRTLDEDIKNIRPNDHLRIFRKTYEGIIDGCRRTES